MLMPSPRRCSNGGQALRRSRNLHQDVGPVNLLPKAVRLRNRALRVASQGGRHFDADKAVPAVGGIINRAENVGGSANVLDFQCLEDQRGLYARLHQFSNRLVIVVAAGNGFLKYAGIGGYARYPVGIDQRFQVSGSQLRAADVIKPNALAQGIQDP